MPAEPPPDRESVVIVQSVPPGAADRFRTWQKGVAAAVARFPGYLGTDQYPPEAGTGDPWVVVLHFADRAAARGWLDSPERAEWLAKLDEGVRSHELAVVPAGFGAWFARHAGRQAAPPGWKMVLTVLLGLYPTVMLLTLFVGPHTNRLGLAVSMLIGNALSVSILQWAVMPVLSRAAGPWLSARPGQTALTAAGAAVVVACLIVLAVVFRAVTG